MRSNFIAPKSKNMLRFYTEPPAIPEETPRNVTIIESNRVTLPCPASGTPPPLITWYKDGREITGIHECILLVNHTVITVKKQLQNIYQ